MSPLQNWVISHLTLIVLTLLVIADLVAGFLFLSRKRKEMEEATGEKYPSVSSLFFPSSEIEPFALITVFFLEVLWPFTISAVNKVIKEEREKKLKKNKW